jgi:hypothetical protein
MYGQYGLRKFRDLFTTDQNAFEEKIVAEFDSALNIWRDQIPEHCALFLIRL